MPDPATEAAEAWLTRFIDMYGGMDAGPADPVHAVREKVREFLDAGPTEDDPFTISEQIAAALPGDSRAAALGDIWREELERDSSKRGLRATTVTAVPVGLRSWLIGLQRTGLDGASVPFRSVPLGRAAARRWRRSLTR
jgi:hypothetical protein